MASKTPPTKEVPEHINEIGRSTIQALLNQIDAWERLLGVSPRTSEIRKWYKSWSKRNIGRIGRNGTGEVE